MISTKVFPLSTVTDSCKDGWKCQVKIFLLSFKMSCFRCFCCAMKFLMPFLKLGCKCCIGWKRQLKIFLLLVKISCLRCFYCAESNSEFFICVVDMEFRLFGLR